MTSYESPESPGDAGDAILLGVASPVKPRNDEARWSRPSSPMMIAGCRTRIMRWCFGVAINLPDRSAVVKARFFQGISGRVHLWCRWCDLVQGLAFGAILHDSDICPTASSLDGVHLQCRVSSGVRHSRQVYPVRAGSHVGWSVPFGAPLT
jgi:hypothetical protein